MPAEQLDPLSPRLQGAVEELQGLIRRVDPTATFQVVPGDDPTGIYVIATVDVEDTETNEPPHSTVALGIARSHPLETLIQSHGLSDISAQNSRLEDLKVKIENRGTFQEFNDAISPLSRTCYYDERATPVSKIIPASTSAELVGKELTIKGFF
jgi:hypothetical protein